jgi:predicted nucleic acid-binding protein
MLLIDTDVIIDYLRGVKKASDFLEEKEDPYLLSTITVAELYAGVKGKNEKVMLSQFLSVFQILSVDEDIAIIGGDLRRQYGKSHGTGLGDALIAATAMKNHASLVTLNSKHFPMMKNLIIPYKK